ncbi:hypothetical protein [Streptomyces virginiae]|uniref:RapZ C-terminal domain-containing protein n=1 Tax=Streptomyces virginiae TaxID=1961 RepID=UPI002DDC19D0|nr:hypothetical protein [Streptomyces virginiae]WSC75513.1 hypothetical protein OHA56_03835 [Streptomyces virginiae]
MMSLQNPELPKNAIIRLNSFGYLHLSAGPDGSPVPPAADRIEDVHDRLRDPGAARDILDLDRFHLRVQDVVLGTPGARRLLADLADLPADPSHIAIGCAGGRHRAVDRTTGGHSGPEHLPRLARSVGVAHGDDKGGNGVERAVPWCPPIRRGYETGSPEEPGDDGLGGAAHSGRREES